MADSPEGGYRPVPYILGSFFSDLQLKHRFVLRRIQAAAVHLLCVATDVKRMYTTALQRARDSVMFCRL